MTNHTQLQAFYHSLGMWTNAERMKRGEPLIARDHQYLNAIRAAYAAAEKEAA